MPVQQGTLPGALTRPAEVIDWDEPLTADQVNDSLVALADLMKRDWLLLDAVPFGLEEAVQEELRNAKKGLKRYELELAIQRIISRGCDGHAIAGGYVRAMLHSSGRCRLSFLIVPVGDRFVATKARWKERNQLWKKDYPYITAIDSVPIEKWISHARRYVSRTNPLTRRSISALQLGYLGHFRKELGLEAKDRIQLTLQAEDLTESTISVPFPDVPSEPFLPQLAYSTYRIAEKNEGTPDWQILDGNIGYFYLTNAGDRAIQAIVQGFPNMRNTDGLIIDLRSNGGGSPEIALLLAQWLIGADQTATIGGYRWSPYPASENFPTYKLDDSGLSQFTRSRIDEAQKRLVNSWSPGHHLNAALQTALLVNWRTEPSIAPFNKPELRPLFESLDLYPYRHKVVVLVDRYTFSAGEVTAAMLGTLPNVLVLGESTRGGGGSSREAKESHIPYALSPRLTNQAVFVEPTGTLIDGKGVVPDVVHEIDTETITGPLDTAIEEARKHILSEK